VSSTLLPAALLGGLAGVVGRDAGLPGSDPVPLAAVGFAAVVVAVALRRARFAALGVLLLAAAIGGWRGAAATLPSGPGSVAALAGGEQVTLEATVADDPRPRGERQQLVVQEVEILGAEPAAGRVLVWLPRGMLVAAGDRIRFHARLEEPRTFDGFDYPAYLARQGIAATASVRAISMVGHRTDLLGDALRGVRLWMLAGLNRLIPEPEAALAAGILLGVRSGIDPAISDSFARAGLTHVVAISGWNIAIVAALAAAAARPLTRLPSGRGLASLAAASAVAGYVVLTGASPSVVRAALMAGALLLARLGGSRSHAISALMLAALVMIVVSPPVVWDVGFQLSALATAGLIWFGAIFEAKLRRWPALLREPVALTMAAQVTTLPVILLNFERLSLVAPLANVMVVPMVPLVMLASAVAAPIGAIHEGLADIGDASAWMAGGAAWLYLRLMVMAGHLAASIPFSSVELAAPPWLAALWYPGLLLAHRRLGRAAAGTDVPSAVGGGFVGAAGRPLPMLVATVAAVALLTVMTQPDGRLHLVMLDIGQGDAILVVSPSGRTALVDGGPDPDLTLRRLGERLPFWQRRLDVIVLTHPHEDHVAGLVAALERFEVKLVLEPGRDYDNPTYPRFVALAHAEPGSHFRLARTGDVITLDRDTQLTVLFPDQVDADAPLLDGDINNASVVMLLESGTFRALLTGDAEAPVEALLLERGRVGHVDVLKVGHHGSESSTTPAFLAAASPRMALISCGIDNDYGHPHAITLEHLSAIPGLVIHRTDTEGTIEVASDGRTLPDAGSIGPWWFPVAIRRSRSSIRWSCRPGSWCIRAALRASRPRRHAWWPRPAFRWTSGSSRSPPCCTTSTSHGRERARASTARLRPNSSPRWASRSWRLRWRRTR
jgi:competence protein ComEC